MQKITPFLWYDKEAGEAAKFYAEVFKGTILNTQTIPNTPSGTIEILTIKILGQEFTLMSAGPVFKITPAISFIVSCENQEEVDYYWDKLSAVPEAEQCGWLQDKYGVSWQIIPTALDKLTASPDKKKAAAATQAMLTMKKLDIAALTAAYENA